VRTFFDTNVLVYANVVQDAGKREVARAIVAESISGHEFVVSAQVLAEFYATTTRRRLLEPPEAMALIQLWSEHDTVPQSPDLVLRAIALHQRHTLSFWDAMVVQAALDARCDVLLSEDLQHGRRFGDLEIRNPFVAGAAHEPPRAPYRAQRNKKRRTQRVA
jgi:predicted nucleic acid-binding protein